MRAVITGATGGIVETDAMSAPAAMADTGRPLPK